MKWSKYVPLLEKSTGKTVYEGDYSDEEYENGGKPEWVNVRNYRNKTFKWACSPCSICYQMAVGMVWYSIISDQVRCMKCFTPTNYDER